MKKLLTIALMLAATAAGAQGLGGSHGVDLDALWNEALTTYDMDSEDAVLLLEGRSVVFDGGALATTVHQIVWITSAQGLRSYADLRVPWNSADSTLEVVVLRTWRDGRWWPDAERISDTAVVHTLPYAVDHADDYTTLRETMLLHDGVELPCLMETRYTITQTGLPGADGAFVLPQRDPAVRVRFSASVPEGASLQSEQLYGAPRPEEDSAGGMLTRTWTVNPAPALGLPIGADPAEYEPTVVWSTWEDNSARAEAWRAGYEPALDLGAAVADSVDARVVKAAGPRDRLDAVLGLVRENVRLVRYGDRFQTFTPRTAARTWATGYGTALDRGILIAAALERAGLGVEPCYLGRGLGGPSRRVHGLSDAGTLHLIIDLEGRDDPQGQRLVYDVGHDRLLDLGEMYGRRMLLPLTPTSARHNFAPDSELVCELVLRPAEDGGWAGRGYVDGGHVFAAQTSLTAAGGLARTAGGLAGSLLAGAEVANVAPAVLEGERTAYAFDFTVAAPEDDVETRRLVLGAPSGGLLEQMPHGVHLADAARTAPVILAGSLRQSVRLRIVGAAESVGHLPASRTLENEAGSFVLTAAADGDDLVLLRSLSLDGMEFDADRWSDLRSLLLEEQDAANGTVVLD